MPHRCRYKIPDSFPQEITDTPDHVKNYRPKVLVMTGNPAHRPSLVDFANIITKKISILIAGHVITDQGPVGDIQTFQHLTIHPGEPGKPEGRDAEVAEGP